jgi:hypothetical protein
LNAELNPDGKVPFFESVAMKGTGVFETFRGVSHMLMQKVTRDLHRSPQASARAAREESAARAAKRPAGTRAEDVETPARAPEVTAPMPEAQELAGSRDPFAAPAKAAAPVPEPAPELPGLSLDVDRPALELGFPREGAFTGRKAPAEPKGDEHDGTPGLEVDTESTVGTHAEDRGAEAPPRRPAVRFEERTLTLGSAASPKGPAVATEPAPARQEISIPVRVPAGGSRQIVIRITLEAE